MQKPKIVQYFEQKYKTDMVLAVIFCFAYLKVNDTKDRILTDIFEFSTPKLCNKQAQKIISTQMPSKVQCFIFQPT